MNRLNCLLSYLVECGGKKTYIFRIIPVYCIYTGMNKHIMKEETTPNPFIPF